MLLTSFQKAYTKGHRKSLLHGTRFLGDEGKEAYDVAES